jgi:hypothetical protein
MRLQSFETNLNHLNRKELPMDKYVKKYVSKDEAEFLKAERSPWEASASGVGYNQKFSDDDGFRRGSNHDDSDSAGLRNKLPEETGESPHEKLARLIDGQVDQPAGKMLGGGGGVSDNKVGGVGRGGPKYAPKSGPIGNMRKR